MLAHVSDVIGEWMKSSYIPSDSEKRKRRYTTQYLMIKDMQMDTKKNDNARWWFENMPYGMRDRRHEGRDDDGRTVRGSF